MGYFANGTEGMGFQEAYCVRCVNFRDKGDGRGHGCPIFDLHLLWNYDANKDSVKREALSMFIPQGESGNKECEMFIEAGGSRE